MEEKKKRPRISRSGGGFSLKERPKVHFPGDENNRSENNDGSEKSENRPYNRDRPYNQDRNTGQDRPYNRDRPYNQDRNTGQDRPYNRDRPYNQDRNAGQDRPYNRDRPYDPNRGGGFRKPFGKKPFRKKDDFVIEKKPKPALPSGEGMPLNKYLAHCGIASRRKAVEFIQQGLVIVNGEVKLEPYYRIVTGDVVTCEGKPMEIQERKVYLLLNKPKNVITTTDDEHGRATVLDIVDPNYPERLYPVGRLDRDTTGLLLITNDGELAAKLSHPSYKVLKQYRVGLDHGLSEADYERIMKGVELEDGEVPVNWIRFAEDHPERDIVELEIMVGRNRIVRRLFESLGYRVRKLDRFYFAGLTKKDLPRGAFRELTQREIVMLKHFTGHPSTTGGGEKESESKEKED
jgi:23S rRNA pseudouridine2605 synthase